jgi:integrase
MKLTQERIRALACPPGRKDRLVFDDEQKGLAVRVAASGGKSYLVQYRSGGAKRRAPLGACDAISLAAARSAARAVLGDVAHGKDPASERKEKALAAKRKAARDAFTFGKLTEDWAALHLRSKRPSYAYEAVRAIRTAFQALIDRPAASLDRQTVVRAIDQLAKDGSPVMAARAAAYARACFRWAVKRGALDANPFADLPVAATAKRERVLADAEIAAIWRGTQGGYAYHAIVRLLMLTGQRRDEVAAMRWDELDSDLSTWTIPGSRTKNHSTHIVPLSKQARAIIAALPRLSGNPHVFVGRGSGPYRSFARTKTALDRSSGVDGWTLHDLRRTCATGLQKLGVRLEVTEAVLNHVSGSRGGIVGVYQRHDWADEKRTAFNVWGAHVDAIVRSHAPGHNFIRLHSNAAHS